MVKKIDDWEAQVEQTEEKEEDQADVNRFEIINYPADITLQGYKEQYDQKQIVIPDFQRKYVWDQVRASKLIESFLLGLPVPGIFLYKERQGTKLLVIDGNQRVSTIVNYFKGTFRDKKFTLKNVFPEWNGKAFEDLSEQDQFKLSTAVMRATIIQQLNPDDQSSIYYIFERLNTGGVNLNSMEVRMCVADGTFTNLLKRINHNKLWRKIIQKENEDNRVRDIELILRVIALAEKSQLYEKPMKKFLNDYTNDNKNQTQEWLSAKETSFIMAVEKAYMIDEKPFHLKGKLNYAALDSILIALMETPINEQSILKAKYDHLIRDDDFLKASTINTSDKLEILNRIKKAKEIFC